MAGIHSWKHIPEDKGRVGLTHPTIRKTTLKQAKVYIAVLIISMLMDWTVFPMFYGATYKRSTFVNNIKIQVFDLDGGPVGTNITNMILSTPGAKNLPRWELSTAASTVKEAERLVQRHKWGAFVINPGLTNSLTSAIVNGTSYDPTKALTVLTASGRHPVGEIMYLQPAMRAAAAKLSAGYSMAALQEFKKADPLTRSMIRPNPTALVNPIGFTVKEVAPYNFSLSPVVTTFGFLTCTLCIVAPFLLWKLTTFELFRRIRYRDLVAFWLTVIFVYLLFISLYFSLAFLAYKGPGYSSEQHALPYTAGKFFSIWFTAYAVLLALCMWLFACYLIAAPSFLGFISVMHVIPNVVSTIVPAEMTPRFFSLFHALPFYNGTMLFRYITSGSGPQIGTNLGVILGEVALMLIVLPISIWFRQYTVLSGIADPMGSYRGNAFFESPVPYYKDAEKPKDDGKTTSDDGTQGASSAASKEYEHITTDRHNNSKLTIFTLASEAPAAEVAKIVDDNGGAASFNSSNLGI
ncbi:hypothetical protein GQ54DRAFT_285587 [Martensiomyces pterosporus]|nr:hypothetical protein GQ54DRAFT_285587 [Martensiomyces pterosporus]